MADKGPTHTSVHQLIKEQQEKRLQDQTESEKRKEWSMLLVITI